MKKIIIESILSIITTVAFFAFAYVLLWYAHEVGIPT